jgi:hypothetical protein
MDDHSVMGSEPKLGIKKQQLQKKERSQSSFPIQALDSRQKLLFKED